MAYTPTQADETVMGGVKKKPAAIVNNAMVQNPRPYNGEAIQGNNSLNLSRTLGAMSDTINGTNNNESPYVARVNEAVNSVSNIDSPVIKPDDSLNNGTIDTGAKISNADLYKQGYDNATNDFKSGQKGTSVEDFTKTENQRAQAETDAIRARVRAAIQQGVGEQNKIINDAPAQFVDPMNKASFQGAKNLQAMNESMARRGRYFSGDMDNAEMMNRTATQNDINDLENTKQKMISDARQAIANLQAQGSLKEVEMVQDAAAKSLERLQNQINIIDDRANRTNETLYTNATNALKTQYDIKTQDRSLGASITGVDPQTGLPTASMQQFNKTYDSNEAQRIWDNAFKDKSFDYQKARDSISDKRYDTEWSQKLDEVAYSRSKNNPSVKAQIINNMMSDIQLGRMQDANSPENQLRYTQAKTALDALNKQLAITPEMTVKQFNAGLDKVYADISQGWASVNNQAGNLALNREEFQAKKSSGMYDPENYKLDRESKRNDASAKKVTGIIDNLSKLYVGKVFDPALKAEVPKIIGDTNQLRQAILGKNLSDDETGEVLSYFGLPTK